MNDNYENGAYSRIAMSWSQTDKRFVVGKREGSFEGMIETRPVEVRIISPQGVKEYSFVYDGEQRVINVE